MQHFRIVVAVLIGMVSGASFGAETAKELVVASVQMRSTRDPLTNAQRIATYIREGAAKGARVVVFPECALPGYYEDVISKLSAERIAELEKLLLDACRESAVAAIVGSVYREGNKLYNSALVITPSGKIIERFHKVQLAEGWPAPGDHLSVFPIEGIRCAIIICHDERYPELVRLPVLAGAQLIFYISHESGLKEEHKIGPYRAQIQARAVENTVFVVQANAPANRDGSGSHGHSRIIAPDGNIMQEASVYGEEVLMEKLEMRRAKRSNARNSIERGPLRDWWKEGLKQVRIIE